MHAWAGAWALLRDIAFEVHVTCLPSPLKRHMALQNVLRMPECLLKCKG